MQETVIGNALPLSPQQLLRGPCPKCDCVTDWSARDASYNGIQQYPGVYRCDRCDEKREPEFAHRWRGTQIAHAMTTGCDCWRCNEVQTDRDFVGLHIYLCVSPEGYGGHFLAAARALVALKTRDRNAVPLRVPSPTHRTKEFHEDTTLGEELALAAGGVIAISEAEWYLGTGWPDDLDQAVEIWRHMDPKCRPELLLRFHSRPDREALERALEPIEDPAVKRFLDSTRDVFAEGA